MKLYEIDKEVERLIEEGMDPETGELLSVDAIEALLMEKETKCENIACWIKDLNAEVNALKAERDAFNKRIKTAQNKADSLKNYLALCLNGQKLDTTRAKVYFRTNKSVMVENEPEFIDWAVQNHSDLLRYKLPEINREALKEALQTEEIPGAYVLETKSVVIK